MKSFNQQESREGAFGGSAGSFGEADPLSAAAAEIIRTREIRRLAGSLAPELMKAWAGSSRAKQAVALPLGGIIERGMKKEAESAADFSSLLDDPDFMGRLAAELPEITGWMIEAALKLGKYIESLPPEEQAEYAAGLFSEEGAARAGELVNLYAGIVNGMYEKNPCLFTDAFMPAVHAWVEQADFGELRDALEHATPDIMEFARQFWTLMRQHPAKVVSLLSAAPSLVNIVVYVLKETVREISGLFRAPDMIADFMLSVLRRIDGKTLGELINASCELARQVRTGSGLLGEPGSPAFRKDAAAFLRDVVETVDSEVLNKARLGLAEGGRTMHKAFIENIRNNPEKFISFLETSNKVRNIRIRKISEKLSLFEDIAGEGLSEALAQSIKGLDTHDAAEAVNTISRTLNRIREEQGGLDVSALAELVNGLDLEELRDAVEWAADELGGIFRPAGRIIAPHLVRMMCGWAGPEKDGSDREVQEAVDALRSLITGQEVEA